MTDFSTIREMLPFLIPIGIIEFGLMAFALFDLVRREVVKGGRKWPWALVIVLFGIIGPVVYLLIGREQY